MQGTAQTHHTLQETKTSKQANVSRSDMARLDVTEVFHGISFPGHLHTQDSLQLALKFTFKDTDILIASYPKSGKKRRQTDGSAAAPLHECAE